MGQTAPALRRICRLELCLWTSQHFDCAIHRLHLIDLDHPSDRGSRTDQLECKAIKTQALPEEVIGAMKANPVVILNLKSDSMRPRGAARCSCR